MRTRKTQSRTILKDYRLKSRKPRKPKILTKFPNGNKTPNLKTQYQ